MPGQTLEYWHVYYQINSRISAIVLALARADRDWGEQRLETGPASPAEGQTRQFLERERKRDCKKVLAARVQILFYYLQSRKNYGLWIVLFTRIDIFNVHSMYFKNLNYSAPCPNP